MSVATKIAALFQALTQEGLDAMPPAERRRLADTCRHWAEMAERGRRVEHKASGLLALLRRGDRAP